MVVLGGGANAAEFPFEVIEEDRDPVEQERVPSAAGVNPDAHVPACSAGEGPLRATVADGKLVLPEAEGVETWEIRALAVFGQERIEWTEDVGLETVDLVLPEDAYVDGYQREWVTELRLRLVGRNARGRAVEVAEADPVWFVLPTGQITQPVWLDAAAKREQAPVGAWGPEARAAMAPFEGSDRLVSVEPPQGGAK